MNYPCKDCVPPKRHHACWDNCDEYKEVKKQRTKTFTKTDEYFYDKSLYLKRKYGWRY